jgi:hypothetical protein
MGIQEYSLSAATTREINDAVLMRRVIALKEVQKVIRNLGRVEKYYLEQP